MCWATLVKREGGTHAGSKCHSHCAAHAVFDCGCPEHASRLVSASFLGHDHVSCSITSEQHGRWRHRRSVARQAVAKAKARSDQEIRIVTAEAEINRSVETLMSGRWQLR